MSVIQTFVDAFKRAAGKQPEKPKIDIEEIRSSGGLGSTDQFRPAPKADAGKGIDRDNVAVGSADPEEGGEATPPTGPEHTPPTGPARI